MQNTTIRTLLRFVFLLIILAWVSFLVWDVVPLIQESSRIKKEIRKARSSIETLTQAEIERREKELTGELKDYRDAALAIGRFAREVQKKSRWTRNIPLATLNIEDLADAASLKLSLIRPLQAQMKEGYEILPIELQFQTTFPNVIRFLQNIKDSESPLVVERLSLKQDKQRGLLNASLILHVLFESGGAEADKGGGP